MKKMIFFISKDCRILNLAMYSTQNVSLFSTTGTGNRRRNEDRIFNHNIYHHKSEFFVGGICDGHDGSTVAQFLKAYIPNEIEKQIKKLPEDVTTDDIVTIGKLVISTADESIKTQFLDTEMYTDDDLGGSTLSFYIVSKSEIMIFQIGDSFVSVYDIKGNCLFQTKQHCKKM